MQHTITRSPYGGLEVRMILDVPTAAVDSVVGQVAPGQALRLDKAGDLRYELRGAAASGPSGVLATLSVIDGGKTTEVVIVHPGAPDDPEALQTDLVRKFARAVGNTLFAKSLVPGNDLQRMLAVL